MKIIVLMNCLPAKDKQVRPKSIRQKTLISNRINPARMHSLQRAQRHNNGSKAGGYLLDRIIRLQLIRADAQNFGNHCSICRSSKLRRVLPHPQLAAAVRRNRNLPYPKIQHNGAAGISMFLLITPLLNLLLDNKGRPQTRMTGKGHLCIRGENPHIITAVHLLI
ncbi:hypothetical protein D3C80_1571340 [compost metagenome]